MRKVVVAMSGGIDSSVTALILKNQGYEVTGITLRMFRDSSIKCCGSEDSIEKFKKICNYIGIKYYVKDATSVFKKYVMDNFVENYLSAMTPNPCIECNRYVKFDYLLEIAKSMDSKLATGHYAIIEKNGNEFVLKRGVDSQKDQSYFLYPIKRDELKNIILPLGGLKKVEVKKIARENKLPIDLNKESRDICFIPEGNYYLWLKKNGYIKNIQGYFKDKKGNIIGTHKGYYKYTIGQRKGLGVSSAHGLYVVDINPYKNEVVVGELKDSYKSKVLCSDLNWLCEKEPSDGDSLFAQVRYRHKPAKGLIKYIDNNVFFEFEKPQFALTPGQSIVFYDGDRVTGGGAIAKVL